MWLIIVYCCIVFCIWMTSSSINIYTLKHHSMSTCRENKHTQRHLVEAENAFSNCENLHSVKNFWGFLFNSTLWLWRNHLYIILTSWWPPFDFLIWLILSLYRGTTSVLSTDLPGVSFSSINCSWLNMPINMTLQLWKKQWQYLKAWSKWQEKIYFQIMKN